MVLDDEMLNSFLSFMYKFQLHGISCDEIVRSRAFWTGGYPDEAVQALDYKSDTSACNLNLKFGASK